ncbi:Pre-mRNA-splicing factor 38B [Pleurostoma richardsiae]|uniref:Pre-mRNA-splicing factor 38B n=1 Tax=Pleurostoma richardsiae TaxID=41990 RepID=A0AA38RPD5_9PEZI|nr:Pre-mRNA-splicing factor 38B [Pleurostoma richardsiae]
MANDTILTDEYVADLLAKEAKDCSVKYSAMGLDAYKSTRPSNKLKPNTRFLRHIIKETKNHNEALLAKESAESQARLQDLKEAAEEKRKRHRPEPKDIRNRQLGDITAILQGRKKRRGEEADASKGSSSKSRDDRERRPRKSTDGDRHHRRHDKDLYEKSSRSHRHGRLSPPSEEEYDDDRSRRERREKERSRSPKDRHRKHRHRSPLDDDEDYSKSRHRRHRHRSEEEISDRAKDGEDSDPLEDIIGPLPPPPARPPRGRGALSGSSRMDNRFADDYDPKSDVQLDDAAEGDDWDEALEALRDRARWRQQGAERLRAAGFTDEQISKWEKSGGEKDIEDVRWSRAGEKREWDRGKVEGEDIPTTAVAERET